MDAIDIFGTAVFVIAGMMAIGVGYMRYRLYDPTWWPNRIQVERRIREREEADQALLESGI